MRPYRRPALVIVGACLVAALAGQACAQAPAAPVPGPSVPNATGRPVPVPLPPRPAVIDFTTADGWRASKLAGLALQDTDGKAVGTVRDVVLDRTGQVRTVLVSAGGLLGVGEREILLPFESIAWMVPDRDAAGAPAVGAGVAPAAPLRGVVNLPRAQIDAAPTAP